MSSEVSLVAVARIIKPFGLRGEVKLHLLADLQDFLLYPEFLVRQGFFLKRLVPINVRGGGKIVLFEGYASRDDAEMLRGKMLYVREEDLVKKNHVDEFYPFDLEGLSVVNLDDEKIGIVREVIELNGRWYLDVMGDKDVLIPFVKPLVKNVEWQTKTVRVDLPEGLLDL